MSTPTISHADWPADKREKVDILYADWFEMRLAVKTQMEQLSSVINPAMGRILSESTQDPANIPQIYSYDAVEAATGSPLSTEYL